MAPTQFFKCLSEDIRLHSVLLIFEEGELCVCELMEALDQSQPKISRHLAQLRNCGLLHDERREQWVYYSLNPSLPQWMLATLDTVRTSQESTLKPLLKKLKSMKDRPARC